jgi:hypothetical protein
MKPASTSAAILFLALQAACAANAYEGDPNSQEYPPPPPDVMAIRTYWVGQKPPCPVVRVMELSAASENGLRWGAWNARAQAVVSVRVRGVGSMPATRQDQSRVYEGVAVRFAEGCSPADSAAKSH